MSKALLTYKEHQKQLPRLVCYDNNFFQAEAAANNADATVTIEPQLFSSKNRRATNWVCLNCVSRLNKEYRWHMAYALVIFFQQTWWAFATLMSCQRKTSILCISYVKTRMCMAYLRAPPCHPTQETVIDINQKFISSLDLQLKWQTTIIHSRQKAVLINFHLPYDYQFFNMCWEFLITWKTFTYINK